MKHASTSAAAITALAALVALTGCGESPSNSASSAATFTAKAKLRDQTVPRWSEGENCDSGNHGTMGEGTEVRIEAKGNTVAMGSIEKHGIMAPKSSSGYFCDYELAIKGVPAGMSFYTINLGEEMGHKEVSEADLKDGVELKTSTFEGGR